MYHGTYGQVFSLNFGQIFYYCRAHHDGGTGQQPRRTVTGAPGSELEPLDMLQDASKQGVFTRRARGSHGLPRY